MGHAEADRRLHHEPADCMSSPRLLSAGAAGVLFATTLSAVTLYARRMETRYVHTLAPQMFLQKHQGVALQRVAFRQADLLPIYGSAPHARVSRYRGERSVASLRARTFGRRLARQPHPLLCRSAARETSQPRSSSSGRLGDALLLTRPAGLEFRAAAAQGRRLDERAEPRAGGGSAQSGQESVWLRKGILDRARPGDREAERTLPSRGGH